MLTAFINMEYLLYMAGKNSRLIVELALGREKTETSKETNVLK